MREKLYSFDEVYKMLHVGKSTLFAWLNRFGQHIPGATHNGRLGWSFHHSSIECLSEVKSWIRLQGWSIDQVIQELQRRESHSGERDSIRVDGVESHSDTVSDQNAIIRRQNSILPKLVGVLKNQKARLDEMSEQLELARKERSALASTLNEVNLNKNHVQIQLSEVLNEIKELRRPWYSRLWKWLNQPITWNKRPVEIEISGFENREKTSEPVEELSQAA